MASKLIPVKVGNPGIFGINRQQSGDVLPMDWAVQATNVVINGVGKISSRRGFKETDAPGEVLVQHAYFDGAGGEFLLFSTATGIYLKDNGGTVFNVTGGSSGGSWEFTNVRGGVYGRLPGQPGHYLPNPSGVFSPVVDTDTGALGAIQPSAFAHAPLAALGRLWCLDGQKLLYTSTLSYSEWAGSFDLSFSWVNGVDTPTGLAYFDGDLVVFGEESIIVYKGDFDPLVMELREAIGGLGCPFPRTIVSVGNDIMFLSNAGVRRLGRSLAEGKMPVGDVTVQIHDALAEATRLAGRDNVHAVYDSREGYYLLLVEGWQTVWVLHTRLATPAGTPPITEWLLPFKSLGVAFGGVWAGVAESLCSYKLTGDSYGGDVLPTKVVLQLPWWGVDEAGAYSSRLKSLKRAFVGIRGTPLGDIVLCWAVDYEDTEVCRVKSLSIDRGGAEYTNPQPLQDVPAALQGNHAWWGLSEWVGFSGQSQIPYQLSKTGLVFQLKLSLEALTEPVVIQNIAFQVKLGRLQA